MHIANIMTENVHTVSPSHTLADLKKIFDNASYRHVLVEDKSKLIGVISDRDVLKRTSPFLGTNRESNYDRQQQLLKASEIMTTKMITVNPDTSVEYAAILLTEKKVSCLPVVDSNFAIAGIVSWKDLLIYYAYGLYLQDT